jgi:hypothetical protein
MAAASSTAATELFALSPLHPHPLHASPPPDSGRPPLPLLSLFSCFPPPILRLLSFLFPILFHVFRVEGEGNQWIYFIHFISGKTTPLDELHRR